MKLFMILFFALAVSSASAQSWTNCSPVHAGGDTLPAGHQLNTQGTACYDYSDTTDSETLDTVRCENIDIFFLSQFDGTNNDSTANIMCSQGSAANANTSFIIENTTLDGDESADTEAIYGASCVHLWVDPQVNDPNNPRDSRVQVKCNP